MHLPIHIYEIPAPGVVSLADSAARAAHGLVDDAVVGTLARPLGRNGHLRPANFVANPGFVRLLHQVVGQYAVLDPDIRAGADDLRRGRIVVPDHRRAGSVIGTFAVADGEVIQSSYRPNPGLPVLDDGGFVQLSTVLTAWLQTAVDQLHERAAR